MDLILYQPGQPRSLRRAFCELTGGHKFWAERTKRKETVTHIRLRCQRCGACTNWKAIRFEDMGA